MYGLPCFLDLVFESPAPPRSIAPRAGSPSSITMRSLLAPRSTSLIEIVVEVVVADGGEDHRIVAGPHVDLDVLEQPVRIRAGIQTNAVAAVDADVGILVVEVVDDLDLVVDLARIGVEDG